MYGPNEGYLEVYFDQYCKSCKYCDQNETLDPCNECLATPGNLYSHKPVNWEEPDKD